MLCSKGQTALFLILGIFSLGYAQVTWGNKHQKSSTTIEQQSTQIFAENCTLSTFGRYTQARRQESIYFASSGLIDFEAPTITPLNSTAGEQWEFDGVSEDGTQAFIFGFSRDSNWAFSGTGNLRVYAEFSFTNGSRYAIVDYAEESTVNSCPEQGTSGSWKGKDDLSQAAITMTNPEARAKVSMKTVAPPRYANNQAWPSMNGSMEPVKHFFWVEPIPVADISVSAVIHGEVFVWEGMGCHERIWHAFNWPTCITGMLAVRFKVGPYALSLVEFGSKRVVGLAVPSIVLAQDGQVIFSSRKAEPSNSEDYIRMRKMQSSVGVTTDRLTDKTTGIEVELESPSREKSWRFEVTHKNVGFEYGFSDGSGGTGYSGVATGGQVGSRLSTGPAFVEILKFPKRSWLTKSNYVK